MRTQRPLIDAPTLRALLEDGTGGALARPALLDCRFDLADPSAALRSYRAGHLAGAVHLDLATDLSGPVAADGYGGRHPLPSVGAFVRTLRRAGVREGIPVIAYDAGMEGGAARLWWLARELGLHDVRVLDGGIAEWDGPLEAGDAPTPPEGDVDVPLGLDPHAPVGGSGGRVRDAEDLLVERSGRVVVDVRAAARHRGEHEPIDPVAGHIPGARNLPNSGADGSPPSEELLAALASHQGEIVATCGSGVSACVLLVRLAALGRDDALLYPGSWSDWSSRGLPREVG